MKVFIYLLIVSNGFSVVLAYDDKCEVNDLNALMIRLRQLKTEFHNLKLEYGNEINRLQEVNEKQAIDFLESSKQININKEEIKHLKEVNGKQVKDMVELTEEFSNKSQEIESIKGLISTRVPAFVVQLKEEVLYNCTTKIPFETIILNVGNAYDNTTNHFKAPLAGLYMFIAQLCSEDNYYNFSLIFSIFSYTNNRTYGVSRYGEHAYCSSLTSLANLTANEEVYIKVKCSVKVKLKDQRTMFTGTLLYPEL